MSQNNLQKIAEYYQDELTYLKDSGKKFANDFPKIAKKLDLNDTESSDPHTQQLIESFAFLTAKLQKQINDQYSPIAYEILNNLSPAILKQIPSCTLAHFQTDITKLTNYSGYTVPKGTNVFCSLQYQDCTFTTTHDLNLLPIEIQSVKNITHEDFLQLTTQNTFQYENDEINNYQKSNNEYNEDMNNNHYSQNDNYNDDENNLGYTINTTAQNTNANNEIEFHVNTQYSNTTESRTNAITNHNVNTSALNKEHTKHNHKKQYIQITFKYHATQEVKRPDKLRLYINGNFLSKTKLYAALFQNNEKIILQKDSTLCLGTEIQPIGCDKNEELFTQNNGIHNDFNLLKEYLYFPDKFIGFDIFFQDYMEKIQSNDQQHNDKHHINKNDILQDTFSIYIPIANYKHEVSQETFLMNTVPIVNIFKKITDPINMDYKQIYYPLEPDVRNQDNYEIYDIEKVVYTDNDSKEHEIPKIFSMTANNHQKINKTNLYWSAKQNNDKNKINYLISVSDLNKDITEIYDKTVYAYTTCTNGKIAETIPHKTHMFLDISAPILDIYNINKPTKSVTTITDDVLWQLVSIVVTNHMCFEEFGIQKLLNILSMFKEFTNANIKSEIESIVDFKIEKNNMYLYSDWKSFIKGYTVSITFDEDIPNYGLPFSYVLANFLMSYANINTFIELNVKSGHANEIIKKWEPIIGKQYTL